MDRGELGVKSRDEVTATIGEAFKEEEGEGKARKMGKVCLTMEADYTDGFCRCDVSGAIRHLQVGRG